MVRARYAGVKADGTKSEPEEGSRAPISRLRISSAMTNVEDVETRVVTSGTLAGLGNGLDITKLYLVKPVNDERCSVYLIGPPMNDAAERRKQRRPQHPKADLN